MPPGLEHAQGAERRARRAVSGPAVDLARAVAARARPSRMKGLSPMQATTAHTGTAAACRRGPWHHSI